MKKLLKVLAFSFCSGLLAACITDPKSASGFRLQDGNVQKGQNLFVELQ